MANKMIIDASHPEETRVVVLRGNRVEEFDFESASKRPLRGNIYLAKVTRVEPSLQAAFVDYGGNRHGFLAFSEIHPDYYQIPVADRQALLDEEAQTHRDEDDEPRGERRSRRHRRPRDAEVEARNARADDETVSEIASAAEDMIEAGDEDEGAAGAAKFSGEPEAIGDAEPGEETERQTEPPAALEDGWEARRAGVEAAALDSEALAGDESSPDGVVAGAGDLVSPAAEGGHVAEVASGSAPSEPLAAWDGAEPRRTSKRSKPSRPGASPPTRTKKARTTTTTRK